jgi:dTDP-4-amino-4,6-dideoxygalactose transaminase
MGNMKVPFLDFGTMHDTLHDDFTGVFKSAIQSGRFIGGPAVSGFEEAFASFCGNSYAVGVGNGTDALRFALMATGVTKGDMVITVPNTFIATVEAISQAGAGPIFVDVEKDTSNMDPDVLQEYINTHCIWNDKKQKLIDKKTNKPITAIVPVHLYGQIADMDRIGTIAGKYGLKIVEDACQAHGAEYYSRTYNRWKKAGTIGDAAAFSFYPGKNLGAFGEAGAVTTNNEQVAKMVKMIRDHGQTTKYYHDLEGYNGRLDSIQAGILSLKLKHLKKWNDMRRECAHRYASLLGDLDGIDMPILSDDTHSVYHLYVVHTPDRDSLKKHLESDGIGVGLHYPLPLHKQKAYKHLGYGSNSFPVTEKLSDELLSLPMFPGLTEEQQNVVKNSIVSFLSSKK